MFTGNKKMTFTQDLVDDTTKKGYHTTASVFGMVGLALMLIITFYNLYERRNASNWMLLIAYILLVVSAVYSVLKAKADSQSKGDFNKDLRAEANRQGKKYTDAEFTCASNIVSSSVKDLLSEPSQFFKAGSPTIGSYAYQWALSQAESGASCNDGIMDTYGMCSGAAKACSDSTFSKKDCPSGCNFTSLKDGLKSMLGPTHGEVGGSCTFVPPGKPPPHGASLANPCRLGLVCGKDNKCRIPVVNPKPTY